MTCLHSSPFLRSSPVKQHFGETQISRIKEILWICWGADGQRRKEARHTTEGGLYLQKGGWRAKQSLKPGGMEAGHSQHPAPEEDPAVRAPTPRPQCPAPQTSYSSSDPRPGSGIPALNLFGRRQKPDGGHPCMLRGQRGPGPRRSETKGLAHLPTRHVSARTGAWGETQRALGCTELRGVKSSKGLETSM